jgi:hypothetical protein
MSQFFISYSRKDARLVENIVDALTENDLKPWIDWKSIPKGEDFWNEIQKGVEEADVFLFLISPDSLQSDWCNREINLAVKNGKRILPIAIRNTNIQNTIPEISKRNWIFCREEKDDFGKAIKEISAAFEQITDG